MGPPRYADARLADLVQADQQAEQTRHRPVAPPLLCPGLRRHLFTIVTVAALAVAALTAVVTLESRPGPLDRRVAEVLVAGRHSAVRAASVQLTALGSASVVPFIGLAIAGVAWVRWRALLWPGYCASAPAVAAGVQVGLKILVGRLPPKERLPLTEQGSSVLHRLSLLYRSSFPSGHSTGAAAIACVTLLVVFAATDRRGVRLASTIVGVLLAITVATTRLVLGVHYLSDVVAGVLVGSGVTLAWAALLDSWATRRRRVRPRTSC